MARKIKTITSSSCVKLLLTELERPFARQFRKIEAGKLLFQRCMQVRKLTISTRTQLTASHVNVKHNKAFTSLVHNIVVWYATIKKE